MRFNDLVLDENALHTPAGTMPLPEITRAEFVREVVREAPGESTRETSVPAVAGGAVVGGALFGAAGAVAGGLLGSTVKEEVPGTPRYRTSSVRIVFETDQLAYSTDVARDQEAAADRFARAVEKAVKRQGK